MVSNAEAVMATPGYSAGDPDVRVCVDRVLAAAAAAAVAAADG